MGLRSFQRELGGGGNDYRGIDGIGDVTGRMGSKFVVKATTVVEPTGKPWGNSLLEALKEKELYGIMTKAKSHSDIQIVASGKRKDPSSRAVSGLDLHHVLNAKRGKEERDLRVKLAAKATPFTLEIEGMKPLKKVNPPKFIMYDGKSDSRSHLNHYRQMKALWSHLNVLMCKVFPLSLGDLGLLKWFDKLGFTPRKKIWDDLMLEPPIELCDMASRVEKYARLEEDASLAERQ
ncbi:hypothetical protein Acr_00g0034540 [Actinidia rufa]|uniref:Uncharacterized protein n=1 Tax=Actinidia rufa TaxID=165716 RepID=A0A7J0DFZ7_9ERIC|nr:hypothetical protein Acr_00g0034540 [Actinidia rufa]